MKDIPKVPCGASDTRSDAPSATPTVLATVYAPEQYWGQLYTPDEALDRGTLFEGLYLPLEPICEEADR